MRYGRQTLVALLLTIPALMVAQDVQPTNDAPNPYTTVKDYFKLPDGRSWGSTSSVDIDKDGTSIWAAERCGGNGCLDRTTGKIMDMPTVFKFDASGKILKAFGTGLLIFPHGIYVDKDDNVWVTDYQDNAPLHRRAALDAARLAPKAADARQRRPDPGRPAWRAPRAATRRRHQVQS